MLNSTCKLNTQCLAVLISCFLVCKSLDFVVVFFIIQQYDMGIMVKLSIKQRAQKLQVQIIVTNSDIERQLNKIVGCCRFMWNKALLALVKQDYENYRTMLKMAKMNGGGEGIS